MAHVLIVFGTTEGHTRKVATYIAHIIRTCGHTAEVWDNAAQADAPVASRYDAVLVGASVHMGQHPEALVAYVKAARASLATRPSVFFSVSLYAALPEEHHQREAKQQVARFLEETGWAPDCIWHVAGAIRYREYGFFKCFVMKRIARRVGRDTDTSQNYEYTDWEALTRSIKAFLRKVGRAAPTPRPSASAA